jgi:predicted phage replisome organizer
LKLKDDFFSQKEIKKLRKIAGGDTYTIIYLKLQLLSLENEGIIMFEGVEDNFIEEMALTLDEDAENVKVTLLYLQKVGFIEETNADEFLLPKVLESIGSETSVAVRVRKHRNKQKALPCNTEVTKGNTEIEIEIDKDIEIDINKKNIYTPEFEEFYKLYPNPQNKQRSFKNWRKQLKTETIERLMKAATNYKKLVEIENRERQYIKSSANFFGQENFFIDYLPENFKEPQKKQDKPQKKNGFDNFEKRTYDTASLKEKLIKKGRGGVVGSERDT